MFFFESVGYCIELSVFLDNPKAQCYFFYKATTCANSALMFCEAKVSFQHMQDAEAAISKRHVLILVSVVGSTPLLSMLERQKAGHSEVGQGGTFSPSAFSLSSNSTAGERSQKGRGSI